MATTKLHSRLATPVALAAVALIAGAAALSGPHAPGAWAAASDCPLQLPVQLPARQIVVPILMYHRVTVASPSAPAMSRRLTVHPLVFRRQMTWLKRHGYYSVTQQELFDALVCGRPLARKAVMITFDDGYRDNFYNASPVLARLGLRATAYVIANRISNGDPSFLTWGMLQELELRGIEIGSHTLTHSDLTSLSEAAAYRELLGSRRKLERRLGHRLPWLAYPFGAYNARIERLARRAGYVLAVTTEWGAQQSARRPLALRRLRVLDSTGVRGLAGLVGGAPD